MTVESAFWLYPDWSGGDNLRDPGTRPFWELPPKRPAAARQIGPVRPIAYGTSRLAGNLVYMQPGKRVVEHVCGPFVTLWTGYRYCKECERPAE